LALLQRYVGTQTPIHPKFIELAFSSKANVAIIPFQDLLGLGADARMNNPYRPEMNWKWRFQWDQVPAGLAGTLKVLTEKTKRTLSQN
jgi:4-alpha-glucanotransferase